MIRLEGPLNVIDGVDQEEVEAICYFLRLKRDGWRFDCQVEGYGEDVHPKKDFADRFEATLEKVKEIILEEDGREVVGYFSKAQTYTQPYSCWMFSLKIEWDKDE